MEVKDLTLFSGGAQGSDCEFERIGRTFGLVNVNHFYHGKRTPRGNVEITEEQLAEGMLHAHDANRILKRANIERYASLIGRNWYQVVNSDAVFAISTVSNKQIAGGTAYACIMAVQNNVPCYLYDQEIHQWFQIFLKTKGGEEGIRLHPIEIPFLTERFAGVGTRQINHAGQAAITLLYNRFIENKSI